LTRGMKKGPLDKGGEREGKSDYVIKLWGSKKIYSPTTTIYGPSGVGVIRIGAKKRGNLIGVE